MNPIILINVFAMIDLILFAICIYNANRFEINSPKEGAWSTLAFLFGMIFFIFGAMIWIPIILLFAIIYLIVIPICIIFSKEENHAQ